MEFSLVWWMWLVLGLLLLVGEMLMPTDFFIFFFGIGAVATALTTAIGLTTDPLSQAIAFMVVSLVSLATLRNWLRGLLHKDSLNRDVDSLVGQIATTIDEIPASGVGKVMLRGSPWNARNANATDIAKATRVRVEKVDGITLIVRELSPVDLIEDMV